MQGVHAKLGKRITALSREEDVNWRRWKVRMIKDIVKIPEAPRPIENTIRRGMKHLKTMNLVVKQADKNLGLVPIRGDFYAAMLRKWLTEPSFLLVQTFPHQDIVRRIENTIRSTWAISNDEKEKWIQHARMATNPCPFYAIPKIHKKSPLGSRPISAQHSYILAPMSKTLAEVLLVFQRRMIGITQDTQSFVQRIEKFKTREPFVLMTYDVEACYPSIDLKDAIQTLQDNIPIMRTYFGFWTKILQLIMFNNYVSANGNIYRQMIGTATGTQVAPPFANLYLFHKYKHVLSDPAILLHERYIDDGFLIVKSKPDAERIIKRLMGASNLKLTYEIDEQKAVFLDLVIYKGTRFQNEGRLDLKTFFKPTNRLLYLPWTSTHPASMKAGIITGECIRTLRNSTDKNAWLEALHYIFKGLMARGYPPTVIKRAWKKVRWEERDFYVMYNSSKQAPNGTLIFTRYHPNTKNEWKKLIARHPFEQVFPKRSLKWNKKQIAIMARWPPTLVWSDFRKIGHHLISAKQSWRYPYSRKRIGDQDRREPKRARQV